MCMLVLETASRREKGAITEASVLELLTTHPVRENVNRSCLLLYAIKSMWTSNGNRLRRQFYGRVGRRWELLSYAVLPQ